MKYWCIFLGNLILFVYSKSISCQVERLYFSEGDKIEILNAHNSERKLVGNVDLTWDNSLEEFAANWATTLATRDNGLSHRPNNPYGENCYWTSASNVQPSEAILSFNQEKLDYLYGPVTETNYAATGHYTQVIWYKTTRVGCAAVRSSSEIFVVCNYDPPGNLIGDYPYGKASVRQIDSFPTNTTPKNSNYKPDITAKRTQTTNPNNNQSYGEVVSKNKQNKSKSSASQNLVNVTLLAGAEVSTKFINTPILRRIKSPRDIDFTGSSPYFLLKSTLPKNKRIKDTRGFVAMGFTLNNLSRQEDLLLQINRSQSSYRVYTALNYEIGLQFFKYCDIGFGQISFGNVTTSNPWDNVTFNRVFLRYTQPLVKNLTVGAQLGLSGVESKISQWNMASFNLSLRTRFF